MKKMFSIVFTFIASAMAMVFASTASFSVVQKKNAYFLNSNTKTEIYDPTFMDTSSPLLVKHEEYDFYLSKNMNAVISTMDENNDTYKATYTITNPTSEEVTTEMIYQFKAFPKIYVGSTPLSSYYQVLVNDEPVSKTLNHFCPTTNSENKYDIPSFDAVTEDSYYKKDFKIYQRRFALDTEKLSRSLFMTFDISSGKEMKDTVWGEFSGTNGNQYYCIFDTNLLYADVIFLGQDYSEEFISSAKFYSDLNLSKPTTSSIHIDDTYSKDYTLMQIVSQYSYMDKGVSEDDVYRAIVDKLKANQDYYHGIDFFNLTDDLYGCFRYSLTVPANSLIIHTITAPLFPYVDYLDEDVYDDFLVSVEMSDNPQYQTVSKFALAIHTDGYITGSGNFELDSLVKDATTYTLTLSERIQDSFAFHVCAYQSNGWIGGVVFVFVELMVMAIFGGLAIMVIIGLLCFYLVTFLTSLDRIKKEKKKNLVFLVVEGLVAGLAFPFIAIGFSLSGFVVYGIVACVIAGIVITLDLIRAIVCKNKFYEPLIFIGVSIPIIVFASFGNLTVNGVALILVIMYSIYFFVKYLRELRKAKKD